MSDPLRVEVHLAKKKGRALSEKDRALSEKDRALSEKEKDRSICWHLIRELCSAYFSVGFCWQANEKIKVGESCW